MSYSYSLVNLTLKPHKINQEFTRIQYNNDWHMLIPDYVHSTTPSIANPDQIMALTDISYNDQQYLTSILDNLLFIELKMKLTQLMENKS